MNYSTKTKRDFTLSTMIHEIIHALGFSSDRFAFFRQANGTPRLARGSDGNPTNRVNYMCSSTSLSWPATSNYNAVHYDPGNTIIGSFTERGISASSCPCPIAGVTKTQADVVRCLEIPRGNCIIKVQLCTDLLSLKLESFSLI